MNDRETRRLDELNRRLLTEAAFSGRSLDARAAIYSNFLQQIRNTDLYWTLEIGGEWQRGATFWDNYRRRCNNYFGEGSAYYGRFGAAG